MNIFRNLLPGLIICFLVLLHTHIIFAAGKAAQITFDPPTANFTADEKSLVYLTVHTQGDTISAATVHIKSTGGVHISDILPAVDASNTLISDTKIINKNVSDTLASATILFVKNTADLPASIKIPIVVTNGKASSGELLFTSKTSEIINATGSKYTLSEPKKSIISFSQLGQTNNPAPSSTPPPASSMILNLTTTLQGITSDDVTQKTLSGFKIQLVQKNGNVQKVSLPKLISMTVDSAGKWRGSMVVSDMQPGSFYQLLIKGPKHLQKRICGNTPQETDIGTYDCSGYTMKLIRGQNDLDISGITLMTGDLGVQDGILNSFDLSVVQNAIRKSANAFQSDADVNLDGKVDKKDYDIIIQTLSKTKGLDQK